MPDLNLRKQVLESGKTTSRKARSRLASNEGSLRPSKANSKAASAMHTPMMSRQHSQIASRAGSDVDDDLYSNDRVSSESDHFSVEDEITEEGVDFEKRIQLIAQEVLDNKGKNGTERAMEYKVLTRLLQQHYVEDVLANDETGLVSACIKSIKRSQAPAEILNALSALEIIAVTTTNDSIYEDAGPTVKRSIYDEAEVPVKAAAIRTYASLGFFCGISDEEITSVMDFLLDIISSDGTEIEAEDAAEPVIAALKAYGLLATVLEDMSQQSHDALEVILEQLDSSYGKVQAAAAQTIALMYEKSYSEPEEDETLDDIEASGEVLTDEHDNTILVKRYDPFEDRARLVGKLEQLLNTRNHRLNKKDHRLVHSRLKDALQSIENPTHGPHYNDTVGANKFGKSSRGSKKKIQIGAHGMMTADKWWKLVRLEELKRVLHNGFVEHYRMNPLFLEILPVMLEPLPAYSTKQMAKKVHGETGFTDVSELNGW